MLGRLLPVTTVGVFIGLIGADVYIRLVGVSSGSVAGSYTLQVENTTLHGIGGR